MEILYFIVALAIIIFSILTVTSRKILRSATYLLFTLFAGAVIYFMMGYEFLGGVQIAVYAGGIVVLFVFAILLTTKPGDKTEKLESRRRGWGILAAVATAAVTGWGLICRCSEICVPLNDSEVYVDSAKDMHLLGDQMLAAAPQQLENGLQLGGYLLPFEAISVLLLACIIGAVAVARKR